MDFYKAPFTIDGVTLPSTEHYFQALKYPSTKMGLEYRDIIRNANTGNKAALLGRQQLKGQWALNPQDKRLLKNYSFGTYCSNNIFPISDEALNLVISLDLICSILSNIYPNIS